VNLRLLELALAKQRLTLRSDTLRRQLAAAAGDWRPPLGMIDSLRQGVDWLRRHPPVIVAVAVALFVARPRAVLGSVGRGWMLWRLWRSFRALRRRVEAIGVGFGREK